ncbi:MAG: CcoQ/FixQ family Cbb3-type cytochrome c oxidase assembly chaperone [Flavobacteriales bacterium]|nr:CcoQ/FixQ family Cbb3-type cytochrome c oxidase assembly chaperone [Flavobacteriales bacterium]
MKEESTYRNTIKMVTSSVENAGVYQSIALVLFVLFFISVVILVLSRPKNYYKQQTNLPLED